MIVCRSIAWLRFVGNGMLAAVAATPVRFLIGLLVNFTGFSIH
jgi:hypothetical protein